MAPVSFFWIVFSREKKRADSFTLLSTIRSIWLVMALQTLLDAVGLSRTLSDDARASLADMLPLLLLILFLVAVIVVIVVMVIVAMVKVVMAIVVVVVVVKTVAR